MEKFNCLAEAAVDERYHKQGHMGTESISLSFGITDDDIDILSQYTTLNICGKEQEYEVNMSEMKVEFSYSEE